MASSLADRGPAHSFSGGSVGRELGRGASLAIVLLFLVLSSAYGQSQQRLLERAAERGTVRVLVRLRQDFVPEGRLEDDAAVTAQREAIRRVRNRVLDRAGGFGATSVRRFRTVPYAAMEIDSAGLDDLFLNADVVSVVEDRPVPALEVLRKPVPGSDVPLPPALGSSTTVIGADRAWAIGYTGTGRAIAVLDSGVQKTHPFLAGKVISEACYSTTDAASRSSSTCPGGVESTTSSGSGVNCDPAIPGCDHGTHVAGIAAGSGSTFSGVAKGASLVSIQVFSRFDDPSYCGSPPCILSWTSDQILALERVLDLSASLDIAAVNMSLGGGGYTSTAQCDADNDAVKAAIDNLRSVGVATVIAAGNSGYINALSAPGCISTAVSVGSTSDADAISIFSNEAPFLSLYAPGENIVSSVLFGGFGSKSGTSMATPHVAGSWAILKQKNVNASVDMVLEALRDEGVSISSTSGTWTTPRIDVRDAVAALPGPDPRMSVSYPAPGSIVQWPFTVSGWAIDLGASAGTGVDAVHVWAFPAGGGAGVFMGAATLGSNRPSVGSTFGSQFQFSGFSLDSKKLLAPGTYTFQVYSRSTVTGTFNMVQGIPVTVRAISRMAVGAPVDGATVGPKFPVDGWAFNTGAPGTVGVDAVHVWAFPKSGSSPVFLGSARLRISRPDVSAYFGVAEFEFSGFRLDATPPLPLGSYTLKVYVRNTVTDAFDTVDARSITIGSDPRMFVDAPAPGAQLSVPFSVRGWAVDLAASSATGVDAVHVWAFPSGGGSGIFLGSARLGINRPDVAAYFAEPRFATSGFRLDVSQPLPSGGYNLTVYARSTVTGSFNNFVSRMITIP